MGTIDVASPRQPVRRADLLSHCIGLTGARADRSSRTPLNNICLSNTRSEADKVMHSLAYPCLEDILDIGEVGVQILEAFGEEALSSVHDRVGRSAAPLALCQCLSQSLHHHNEGRVMQQD